MISFFKRISLYDFLYHFDRRKRLFPSLFDQLLETDRYIMNKFLGVFSQFNDKAFLLLKE